MLPVAPSFNQPHACIVSDVIVKRPCPFTQMQVHPMQQHGQMANLNHADLQHCGEKRMRRCFPSEVSPDSATSAIAHAISPTGVSARSLTGYPASCLVSSAFWTSSTSSYLLDTGAMRPNLSFDLPVRDVILSADMIKAASAIAAASSKPSLAALFSPTSCSSSVSSVDASASALASMSSPDIAASHVGASSIDLSCERRAIVRLSSVQSRHATSDEDLALKLCVEEEADSSQYDNSDDDDDGDDDDDDNDDDADENTDAASQSSEESDGEYESGSEVDDSDEDEDEDSDTQGTPYVAQNKYARTYMRAPRPNQHAAKYGERIQFSWNAAIQEAKEEAAAVAAASMSC